MPSLRLADVVLLITLAFTSSAPYAPPIVVSVEKNGNVEIAFLGHSTEGAHPIQAYIVSLPPSGKIYQLSQPYCGQGISTSKYESSTEITAASKSSPVLVSCSTGARLNRVIYKPPSGMAEPFGMWDSFKYMVVDKNGARSQVSFVHVVGTKNILVGSDFSQNVDGWVIRHNGNTAEEIMWEPSRQKNLNIFIYSQDGTIDLNAGGHSDKVAWSFCAPSKMKSDLQLAYDGKLEYTLGAFSGDFSKTNKDRESVVLECSTCNYNRGMRFVMPNVEFSGVSTLFSHSLKEDGGWLKDPQNSNIAMVNEDGTQGWSKPSKCEMVEMLSSISEFCILGDHTKWYEGVGLDDVKIITGDLTMKTGASKFPVECMCASVGTQCESSHSVNLPTKLA